MLLLGVVIVGLMISFAHGYIDHGESIDSHQDFHTTETVDEYDEVAAEEDRHNSN